VLPLADVDDVLDDTGEHRPLPQVHALQVADHVLHEGPGPLDVVCDLRVAEQARLLVEVDRVALRLRPVRALGGGPEDLGVWVPGDVDVTDVALDVLDTGEVPGVRRDRECVVVRREHGFDTRDSACTLHGAAAAAEPVVEA
jgi:hypothetical protein